MIDWVKQNGAAQHQKFVWLIEAFVDEALAEMADGTTEQTAAFFEELSRLIHWIATGEINGEVVEKLTEGLRLPLKELESANQPG